MTPHDTVEVGIRRLRDHLSEYVARARDGTDVVITDRGRPVARLVSAEPADGLRELIERGIVRLPLRPKRKASEIRTVRASGDVSGLVKEQRR